MHARRGLSDGQQVPFQCEEGTRGCMCTHVLPAHLLPLAYCPKPTTITIFRCPCPADWPVPRGGRHVRRWWQCHSVAVCFACFPDLPCSKRLPSSNGNPTHPFYTPHKLRLAAFEGRVVLHTGCTPAYIRMHAECNKLMCTLGCASSSVLCSPCFVHV